MIHPYELKAEDVRAYMMRNMKEHFQIEAQGYCCTTDMIYDILMKASAECSSLEATCADLEQVADSNTVREYVNQALPIRSLHSQEEQANQALASCISASMVRKGIEIAIDFHDEPFYGKQESLRAVTCGGQAKKGTAHFGRIATAYVIWRQVRLTLAVHYVLPDEEALEVLKILLERLKNLNFEAKVLYLDKGFAASPIVDHLTSIHQPAIIANPIRGKTGGHTGALSGSIQLQDASHLQQRHPGNFGHESFPGPGPNRQTASQVAVFHRDPVGLASRKDLPRVPPPFRSGMQLSLIATGTRHNHLSQPCHALLPAERWTGIDQCLGHPSLGVRLFVGSWSAPCGSSPLAFSSLQKIADPLH